MDSSLDDLVEPLAEDLLEPLDDALPPPGGAAVEDDRLLDVVDLDPALMVPLEPDPPGRIRLFTKRAWVRGGVVVAEAKPEVAPDLDPRTEPVVRAPHQR